MKYITSFVNPSTVFKEKKSSPIMLSFFHSLPKPIQRKIPTTGGSGGALLYPEGPPESTTNKSSLLLL